MTLLDIYIKKYLKYKLTGLKFNEINWILDFKRDKTITIKKILLRCCIKILYYQ